MEMSGTWEVQWCLVYSSTPTDGTNLRGADAPLEVGPADSTLSIGKLCTWGSGGAEVDLVKGTH
jgi:hypothetical protein